MSKAKLSTKDLIEKVTVTLQQVRRYTFVLFLAFVAMIYGFVLLQINSLSNAQPSSDAVTSQEKASLVSRIDPTLIQQLYSLQDNSVSVKSLFNQARANPFQE